MINRKGFTLIELIIVVIIMSILAAIAIPNYISMQNRANEAKVKGAAHTVQLIAEGRMVRADGIYSVLEEDLLPLLPGGELLKNSFTGEYTEPQFGVAATMPGQVGIQALDLNKRILKLRLLRQDARGNNIFGYVDALGKEQACAGYLITGYGADKYSGDNGIIVDLTSG